MWIYKAQQIHKSAQGAVQNKLTLQYIQQLIESHQGKFQALGQQILLRRTVVVHKNKQRGHVQILIHCDLVNW